MFIRAQRISEDKEWKRLNVYETKEKHSWGEDEPLMIEDVFHAFTEVEVLDTFYQPGLDKKKAEQTIKEAKKLAPFSNIAVIALEEFDLCVVIAYVDVIEDGEPILKPDLRNLGSVFSLNHAEEPGTPEGRVKKPLLHILSPGFEFYAKLDGEVFDFFPLGSANEVLIRGKISEVQKENPGYKGFFVTFTKNDAVYLFSCRTLQKTSKGVSDGPLSSIFS